MSFPATPAALLALLTLSAWLVLLLGRGGFWRCRVRDDRGPVPADPSSWPAVVAVVPARNEAEMIPRSLASLLAQDYPGPLTVVLVDDNSEDQTLALARATADAAKGKLEVVQGLPLAAGWTGKLWALHQGIARALALQPAPRYLLLTDADIEYSPQALRGLVGRAEAGACVLVSLMARLRCDSLAERALVPAFIFFFQMLYPFAWVARGKDRTAAAAGGCMLVRAEALARAGGIESIRGALIDDCALGARLKQQGPVWLGLTESVRSLRPYPHVNDIRHMVTRSAYAQLRFSPLLLAATVAGLALVYLAAPVLTVAAAGPVRWIAALAWVLMALAFWPTLRFYRRSPLWAPLLPAIAAVYLGFTLESALQHARGRGGQWKGRVQAARDHRP